jgi:hypothetical protein
MKPIAKAIRVAVVAALLATLSGCDDPQVYGSIGVSSGYGGYGSYGGWGGSRVHTSISVGGRIR